MKFGLIVCRQLRTKHSHTIDHLMKCHPCHCISHLTVHTPHYNYDVSLRILVPWPTADESTSETPHTIQCGSSHSYYRFVVLYRGFDALVVKYFKMNLIDMVVGYKWWCAFICQLLWSHPLVYTFVSNGSGCEHSSNPLQYVYANYIKHSYVSIPLSHLTKVRNRVIMSS